MGWYLQFYQVRSFQSAQSWPWWWTQSKPEISALFLTLINFLEAQKLSIQLPQATNGRWTYLPSRSTASEDWRVPKAKPSRHLCILRLAFLFPSEEPNHGGPDVAQRDPNEQESISVTKENWLLQILIAGWRGRVSNDLSSWVMEINLLFCSWRMALQLVVRDCLILCVIDGAESNSVLKQKAATPWMLC